jgi:hypothetical protein
MTARGRRSAEVEALLDERAHPMRVEIDRLRTVLLAADPRLTESVKWGGPTFSFADSSSPLATIVLRGTRALTLFFQEGAALPDPSRILHGEAAHVRTARFSSAKDIEEKEDALRALVRAFCARCEGAATRTKKTKSTRRRT